jgi:hypothetical protein
MFKGKNRLSHEIVVLLFEGHMRRVLRMFLCKRICSQSVWHLKVKDGGCVNVLLVENYGTAHGTVMAHYERMVE